VREISATDRVRMVTVPGCSLIAVFGAGLGYIYATLEPALPACRPVPTSAGWRVSRLDAKLTGPIRSSVDRIPKGASLYAQNAERSPCPRHGEKSRPVATSGRWKRCAAGFREAGSIDVATLKEYVSVFPRSGRRFIRPPDAVVCRAAARFDLERILPYRPSLIGAQPRCAPITPAMKSGHRPVGDRRAQQRQT